MTGVQAIRWSMVLAVAGVALVVGWSATCTPTTSCGRAASTASWPAYNPGTIDGLIYSASMVLLDAARRDVTPPPLARWLLAAGIGATLFANVLAGAAYGLLGAAVAAWPALALVGSYELLMWLVRHGVTAPSEAVGTVSSSVPSNAETAAMASLRATLAAGNPWSNNQLADRFGLTRAQATKVRQLVTAEMNGQHPQDAGETPPDA